MKKVHSSDDTLAKKSPPAQSVDDYLASVPEDARAALAQLRAIIKAAAPKAAEVISYQIPTFKYQGRPLVSFGAAKNHCAFYVMSPDVMRAYAAELKDYDIAKGTIRFPADKPLPAALVTKLVQARIAENEKNMKKGELT